MNPAIETVRSFNRSITRRLGVLGGDYLGRERPFAESRLLFEIGKAGASVRTLRTRLGLDSGFLSRTLRALERDGLVSTAASDADARVRVARLTRAGLAELRKLDALSDGLAQSMLAPLSPEQAERLVAAMGEVERLLRTASVEVVEADPADAQAQACLQRYFDELDTRFRSGFERGKGGAADVEDYRPPRGCLLLARLDGEAIGCGALRTLARGVGEIKRMWISPDARGLGIGRRLLAELERAARTRQLRRVRLDTNATLAEALALYRSAGYREIARFNDNPYAQHWFEKMLR